MLFVPFITLHEIAHYEAANKINTKGNQERLNVLDKEDRNITKSVFNLKLRIKTIHKIGNLETTRNAVAPYEYLTFKEAYSYANASSKYAYIMLVLEVFLIPLALLNSLFLIIHLYLYFGTILYLFPSSADEAFIKKIIIANNTISNYYYIHGFVIFIILSYIQYQFYSQINYPPYWYVNVIGYNILAIFIYYIILIWIVIITEGDELIRVSHDPLLATKLDTTIALKNKEILRQKQSKVNNEDDTSILLIDDQI